MIVTPRISLRIALLILAGTILQLAFFSRISLFGTVPDVAPALAVCFGLLGGSLAGAVFGFSTGLLLDTLQYQTLGATSLALILVGYLAGRYRESFDVSGPLALPLLVAVLTVLSIFTFSTLQLMLGVSAKVSPLVLRDAALQALYNALLAAPIFATMRRVLRPALIDDAPRRSLLGAVLRTAGR